MTLPFRRRHHDDEGAHERARSLTSRGLLEPLDDASESWLTGHLAGCGECRQDRDAYTADRELLRTLRDRTPHPPRDLWARTSAALDREARSSRRSRSGAGLRGAARTALRGLPLGAVAGTLIVLVVVGPSILQPVNPPNATPGASSAAVGPTLIPEPTQMELAAGRVGWIRPGVDGSWELVLADISEVCPRSRPSCQALVENDPGRRVELGNEPTGVTISPTENQLVVSGANGTAPDQIFVVPVPPKGPDRTPAPTVAPTSDQPSIEPVTPEPGSPEPSPTSPSGAIAIASGVTVVGETEYSADGQWLAFSARPSDDSTGPDLYLWHVGDAAAVAVTTDHRTYFSAWHDGRVLASRVVDAAAPAATDEPSPAPTADASAEPTEASAAPSGPPEAPMEAHPLSFLLDPATLEQSDIAQPDVWLPVVDPTGRFVAYWSGTLLSTEDGLDWRLGTGQLVLDGWSDGPTAGPEAEPTGNPGDEATTAPDGATADPTAVGDPLAALGPTGSPVTIVDVETAAFKARFDPTGTRLAVWVGEQRDAEVGRLHLLVLDPETGAIERDKAPLPGEPALRRFSIDVGRLAWVSPSGQDGQESTVQVLGWSKDDFGEIRTIPARDLFIVR